MTRIAQLVALVAAASTSALALHISFDASSDLQHARRLHHADLADSLEKKELSFSTDNSDGAGPWGMDIERDLTEEEHPYILEDREYEKRTGKARKVGIAWNNQQEWMVYKVRTAATKYFYTWSPWCSDESKKAGLICCPMLWGWKQVDDFQSQKHKGGKCLMGPNEPNEPGQSNLSPSDGAKIWNMYIRNEKPKGYLLISPAVTSGNDGINWMHGFYDSCGGSDWRCGARVQAVHFYGTSSDAFKSWVNRFHSSFGMNVWVTEMACQNFGGGHQCSMQDVWDFMGSTTAWMTKQSWIGAYFYFGMFWDMYNVNPDNRLVWKSGEPNDLGKFYIGGR